MFPVIQRVPREVFKKILIEGKKTSSGLFLMRNLPNNLDLPRFSVVVSKKVSKSAVRRNLVRRRFMNALRENIGKYSHSDYIFLVSTKSSTSSYEEISKAIKNIL